MADQHENPPADPWAPPPEGSQAGQPGAPARPPAAPSPWAAPPAGGPQRTGQHQSGQHRTGQHRTSGAPRRPASGSDGSADVGPEARTGILLGALGLLTVFDPAVGLAFGLGSAVLGALAVRAARRSSHGMGVAITAAAMGAGLTLVSLTLLLVARLPEYRDYRACLDRAQTHTAQQVCERDFSRSPVLGGLGPRR
ncbi:hypothetical protein EV189_2080 [Motilibacter rhizosphaerae]|uniref:DUF4190 domain-containing protein n=1 Tax=Motilibacter rhizosphaerae TaxID=598652 RepID=A0A4Q7NTA1_9ACTN|nr:hypothetical protein [Motilibacter rhizosphaerae]RZS90295.1 hypothetical protein EV189_2080 [Motilibacter rhizosphaerae]